MHTLRTVRALTSTAVLIAACLAGAGLTGMGTLAHAATAATAAERVNFHKWTTQADFQSGTAAGVTALSGDRQGIAIAGSGTVGTIRYKDAYLHTTKTYAYSTWTSPSYSPGFGATELVSSWDAQTPAGTWLKVELNATMEDGHQTGWLDMGNWAPGDTDIARTSVSPSAGVYGEVDTDTFNAARPATRCIATNCAPRSTGADEHRLARGCGSSARSPRRSRRAPASPPSPLGGAEGTDLAVPQYSQQIHVGPVRPVRRRR